LFFRCSLKIYNKYIKTISNKKIIFYKILWTAIFCPPFRFFCHKTTLINLISWDKLWLKKCTLTSYIRVAQFYGPNCDFWIFGDKLCATWIVQKIIGFKVHFLSFETVCLVYNGKVTSDGWSFLEIDQFIKYQNKIFLHLIE
jgi:hypothetical protein